MTIPFAKAEACGNDFLLVSERELPAEVAGSEAGLSPSMCHRTRGIGADGLILYRGGSALFAMRLFNSDGSPAEISGNGLRCLGAFLFHRGLAEGPEIVVETGAGHLSLDRIEARGIYFRLRARMGAPRLASHEIPFVVEPERSPVVGAPLEVDGRTLTVTALSMGNPHCVVFTDEIDLAELREIGPLVERHGRFPERTNVELVQVLSRGELRMAVWERGAGETASSGTGSAASMVAAVLNGFVDHSVRVHCPGGTLAVDWEPGGDVFVTGEATVIAEGTYLADWSP